jgi:hypothetical protein
MTELDSDRLPEWNIFLLASKLAAKLRLQQTQVGLFLKCRLTQFYLIIGSKATFFQLIQRVPHRISKWGIGGRA